MKAIVYAMHKEVSAPFEGGTPLDSPAGLTLRQLSDDLMVCVCGIGKVNTALGVQHLIDRYHVTEIWNAGVSGCFHPLPAGTLVVATSCVQHDMDTFGDPPGLIPVLDMIHLPCSTPEASLAKLTAAGYECRPGVVATGDWFRRDYERAARIRDAFGALVCDMEGAAAAHVCLRNNVPFRSLKIVSDHLFNPSQYEEYQANLPAAVTRLNEALAVLVTGN